MKRIGLSLIAAGMLLALSGCEKKAEAVSGQEKEMKAPEVTVAVSEKKETMISVKSVEEFDEIVRNNNKVIADFYADWCPPCKKLSPILEDLSLKHDDVRFVKVNVDYHPDLSKRYKVSSIPLVIYFRDGKVFESAVGLKPAAEIEKIIEKMK